MPRPNEPIFISALTGGRGSPRQGNVGPPLDIAQGDENNRIVCSHHNRTPCKAFELKKWPQTHCDNLYRGLFPMLEQELNEGFWLWCVYSSLHLFWLQRSAFFHHGTRFLSLKSQQLCLKSLCFPLMSQSDYSSDEILLSPVFKAWHYTVG